MTLNHQNTSIENEMHLIGVVTAAKVKRPGNWQNSISTRFSFGSAMAGIQGIGPLSSAPAGRVGERADLESGLFRRLSACLRRWSVGTFAEYLLYIAEKPTSSLIFYVCVVPRLFLKKKYLHTSLCCKALGKASVATFHHSV